VARAVILTEEAVREKMAAAQDNVKQELAKFVDNTLDYARREKGLILGEYPAPPLKTKIKGRHAMIVVRGAGYQNDILAVKSYIDEIKPVLIGVDGGADALLELGYRPDIIVGIWIVFLIKRCSAGLNWWFMLIQMEARLDWRGERTGFGCCCLCSSGY